MSVIDAMMEAIPQGYVLRRDGETIFVRSGLKIDALITEEYGYCFVTLWRGDGPVTWGANALGASIGTCEPVMIGTLDMPLLMDAIRYRHAME